MVPLHGNGAAAPLRVNVAKVAPELVTMPVPAIKPTWTASPPKSKTPLSNTPLLAGILTPFPPDPASRTIPPLLIPKDRPPELPPLAAPLVVEAGVPSVKTVPPVLAMAVTPAGQFLDR